MKRTNGLNRKHLYFGLLVMGAATPALAQNYMTTLWNFPGVGQGVSASGDGFAPNGPMVLSADGMTLYGECSVGGENYLSTTIGGGTVFSLPVTGGPPTILHSFPNSSATVENGNGGCTGGIILSGNTLFGMTSLGVIFSVSTTGANYRILGTVPNTPQEVPSDTSGLLLVGNSTSGTLYGVSTNGGDQTINPGGGASTGGGFVFSMPVTGGTPTTIGTFHAASGYDPLPHLVYGNGTLYGTTQAGGGRTYAGGTAGTVFSLPASGGNITDVCDMMYQGVATTPGEVTLSADGSTIYGVNNVGSANSGYPYGQVFSLPSDDKNTVSPTILHTFTYNIVGGQNPPVTSGLLLMGNTLYGVTTNGQPVTGYYPYAGTLFSLTTDGGNFTPLAYNGNLTYAPWAAPTYDAQNGKFYGDDFTDVWQMSPATTTATTYNLAATITGSRVLNGRITQGQTANLGSIINNTGGNGTDNLAYDTLSLTGAAGMSMVSGSGNITPGNSSTAGGTFTATTLGLNTFTPTVGNATNATVGGNAAFGGSSNATVYVDPLLEHINGAGLSDTGNASTTPTPFYRQNPAWGGQNLGNVTVPKQGPGSYTPAYVNNIKGGAGTATGALTINVNGNNNMFGSDTSVVMLGFKNVSHSGDIAAEKNYMTTIEAALTTAGVEWRDAFGDNSNWPTLTSGVDPLTGTNYFQNVADYDIELAFPGGSLTSSQSYFDFNFTDQLGDAGNVVNLVVVPEPASLSLLAIGGIGLLGKRARRLARK